MRLLGMTQPGADDDDGRETYYIIVGGVWMGRQPALSARGKMTHGRFVGMEYETNLLL